MLVIRLRVVDVLCSRLVRALGMKLKTQLAVGTFCKMNRPNLLGDTSHMLHDDPTASTASRSGWKETSLKSQLVSFQWFFWQCEGLVWSPPSQCILSLHYAWYEYPAVVPSVDAADHRLLQWAGWCTQTVDSKAPLTGPESSGLVYVELFPFGGSWFGLTTNYSYLVDPASSYMLVSKIKPCKSKYSPCTTKLQMAH